MDGMSTGMWGTACEPSISMSAPASWARAVISATGLMVPSTLLAWATATMRVRSDRRAAEGVHVELAAGGDRDEHDLGAGDLGHDLPRHDVGVVLHLGDEHLVARLAALRTPQAQATRLIASLAFLVRITPSRGA